MISASGTRSGRRKPPIQGSTGRFRDHSRAASARRSPTSAGTPSPAAVRRPGDPARDVDQESPAGAARRPVPRRPVRTPGPARHRRPGHRHPGRGTRAPGRSPGSRRVPPGAVAPTTSPTVPPGSPARREPGDAGVQRLGRGTGQRRRGDIEILQLAGARVGRPAEQVGEAVRALDEGRRPPPSRGTG